MRKHLNIWDWSRRRRLLWAFVGIVGPFLLYFGWLAFGWPAPLEISREVTYLTEPLTADGQYVDYIAHLREIAGNANPDDDPWQAALDEVSSAAPERGAAQ